MKRKIIIIGAGPGGLASAMLLARTGAEVHVVERLGRVGGRTSTIDAKGFRFDLGPTFFLYPKVLGEIFAACGRDLTHEIQMVKLDPQYRLIFEQGGELLATPNVERMEEAVARLSPQDAPNVRRFLSDNRRKLAAFEPILQRNFSGWKDLLNMQMLKCLPQLKPWQSLDSHLRKYFKDERVRLSFCFQSKYLGMSPFVCPSLFSILSFLEYEYGVFHPIGGCGAVSQAMARIASDMGVKFHLNEPVEEVLFKGTRASGIRTSNGTYQADAVVLNADFARAMRTMVPDSLRKNWTDARIDKKQFSCSTFMMYLGVEGTFDSIHHHNIFLAKDYGQNLKDIEQLHVLSENPSLYVQNASVSDPTLAPRGHSTLYILLPVSHEHPNIDWNAQRERFRSLALKQIKKIGLTDIESRIRYEKIVTPADWSQRYNIHMGATFNLAHNFRQMLHLRPQNRFEDVDGMYLVGGGTHPGSGLPVIFESAKITSRLLMEDLELQPQRDVLRTLEHSACQQFAEVG